MGYDYEIRYKPDKDKKVANALFRLELPSESQILILATIPLDFLKQVKKEDETYEDLKALKQELLTQLDNHSDITYKNSHFTIRTEFFSVQILR